MSVDAGNTRLSSEMSFYNLLARSKVAGVRSLPDRERFEDHDEPNIESVLDKEEVRAACSC